MRTKSHRRGRAVRHPQSRPPDRDPIPGALWSLSQGLQCKLGEHSKSFGDYEGIAPRSVSMGKKHRAHNFAYRFLIFLYEGFRKGLFGADGIHLALAVIRQGGRIILAAASTGDLQTRARRAAREEQKAGADQDTISFLASMDGVIDRDEAAVLIEANNRQIAALEHLNDQLREIRHGQLRAIA